MANVSGVAEVQRTLAGMQEGSVDHDNATAMLRRTLEVTTPAARSRALVLAMKEAIPPEEQAKAAQEVTSAFPQASGDRKAVYITGFAVAGAVVIALALIAWGAADSRGDVSQSILVLGTAFTSALLGGLLGAYKGGGSGT